jgi:putative FmdB family regulatory protein
MPIFEYICRDCGRSFERIVPKYDSATDCTHCNSENIEKQLSVFAVAGASSGESAMDAGCGRCGAAQPGSCGMVD